MGLQLRMFLMFSPFWNEGYYPPSLRYTKITFIKEHHIWVEQIVFDILPEEFMKFCRESI